MHIFLNPGHMPGVDAGAVRGIYTEAAIVLRIGQRVKGYLEAAGEMVSLVQSDNLAGESPEYICVTGAANQLAADVFVSIHCNAAAVDARGAEFLVYDLSGDAAHLASAIGKQLVDTLRGFDADFPDRGIKVRQDLAVLRCTSMPAVLVETAFLSNPKDLLLLLRYEDDIARAIARGITDYDNDNH